MIMKKKNNVRLFTLYRKSMDSDAARDIPGFMYYFDGVATFRKYHTSTESFLNDDLSVGFGVCDSLSDIISYNAPYDNIDMAIDKCITIFKNPKYTYYWQVPLSKLYINKSLECHDNYISINSDYFSCDNCSGKICNNNCSTARIIYDVWNKETLEKEFSTNDEAEARKYVNDNLDTEELTTLYEDIISSLEIDGIMYKIRHNKLNILQLIIMLGYEHGIRMELIL